MQASCYVYIEGWSRIREARRARGILKKSQDTIYELEKPSRSTVVLLPFPSRKMQEWQCTYSPFLSFSSSASKLLSLDINPGSESQISVKPACPVFSVSPNLYLLCPHSLCTDVQVPQSCFSSHPTLHPQSDAQSSKAHTLNPSRRFFSRQSCIVQRAGFFFPCWTFVCLGSSPALFFLASSVYGQVV